MHSLYVLSNFRAGVSPFASARSVLEPLKVKKSSDDQPDLLQLCRDLQMEVVQLKYADKCVSVYECIVFCIFLSLGF